VNSSSEALAKLEQEPFDAVLLEAANSQSPYEPMVLAIQEIRPALVKRILLLTDPEPAEENKFRGLPHISLEKPLSHIWTKLEEILAVQPTLRPVPPGMQNAQLVFDSFSSPKTAGTRGSLKSARQLAYQHGSTTVNVLIHAKNDGVRIALAGQVLDVSMRAVHGLPVLLSDGSRTLAETTTSQFGEFGLEVGGLEYAGLQIRLSEGSWIHMAMEDMDLTRKPM
jgi:hypothetical protein